MQSIFTDTHAHLSDAAFDPDREEVIASLRQAGVYRVIEIACEPRGFEAAARLAERHEEIYLAFGIHPEFAESYSKSDIERLYEYLKHPKCVALGEIGLDYHWKPFDKDKQLELLRLQLGIAQELGLPVSLHIRDAIGDCLEVLENTPAKGVMHCFSGSAESAERFTGLGLYIAFGGALTFRTNKKAPAACERTPLDRLLTETDCPYMAPEPNRGKRCDPSMIPLITAKMAEIKGITTEEMAEAADRNMRRLFFSGK